MTELKEAVEYFKTFQDVTHEEDRIKRLEQFDVLLNLAKDYLAIEGFPEEKEIINDDPVTSHENIAEIKAFNEALRLSKLAMIKKCEGLEELLDKIPELRWKNNQTLANAIRKELGCENKS